MPLTCSTVTLTYNSVAVNLASIPTGFFTAYSYPPKISNRLDTMTVVTILCLRGVNAFRYHEGTSEADTDGVLRSSEEAKRETKNQSCR